MKKTILALSLTTVFAANPSFAADLYLYGVLDEGLAYTRTNYRGFNADADASYRENRLEQQSGYNTPSRWGLTGTEALGNGYSVGFRLESGFNGDDGTMQENRLFRREAALTLSGPFGALAFGRMGGVGSAAGTYDTVYLLADAFDGGDNNVFGLWASDRYDNMVTYQTPTFAGLQATAQYSFKNSNLDAEGKATPGTEGKPNSDRYASLALTGNYGHLQVVAAYERQIWSNTVFKDGKVTGRNDNKDQNTFYLGGNYDFGVACVFLLGQYVTGARFFGGSGFIDEINDILLHFSFTDDQIDNGNHSASFANTQDGLDYWGLHAGTIIPIASGDLTLGLYYAKGDTDTFTGKNSQDRNPGISHGTAKFDLTYYGASARYTYPLSKRTALYVGAGYAQLKIDADTANGYYAPENQTLTQVPHAFSSGSESKITQVYLGLTHAF